MTSSSCSPSIELDATPAAQPEDGSGSETGGKSGATGGRFGGATLEEEDCAGAAAPDSENLVGFDVEDVHLWGWYNWLFAGLQAGEDANHPGREEDEVLGWETFFRYADRTAAELRNRSACMIVFVHRRTVILFQFLC